LCARYSENVRAFSGLRDRQSRLTDSTLSTKRFACSHPTSLAILDVEQKIELSGAKALLKIAQR
jgi:hypothetical protein